MFLNSLRSVCVILSTSRKAVWVDECWKLILMASETASSADEETVVASVAVVAAAGADKRGKHRILAELKRLDQDSKFLRVS